MKRAVVVVVSIGIAILLTTQIASAAVAQHMTLTPAARELSADPGGSVKSYVTVVNQNDTNLTVELSTAPYSVKGLEYTPDFLPLAGTTDASKWLSLGVSGVQTIGPRRTLDVPVTLNVPESTAPGGYYGVLFAVSKPSGIASTGVVTQARLGSIVYITVNGESKQQAGVSGEGIGWFHRSGDIPLSVIATNYGGVHFNAEVKTSIKNIIGREVYRDSQQRYVLPQTKRRITTDWRSDSIIGLFRVERSVRLPDREVSLPTEWCVVIHPLVGIGCILSISGMIGYMVLRHRRTQP